MKDQVNRLKVVGFTFFVMIVFSLVVATALILPSREVLGSEKAATIPTNSISIPLSSSLDCTCNANTLKCSDSCNYTPNSTGNISNPLSCSRESAVLGNSLSPTDLNSYCNRVNRTIGDADGDGLVDEVDYFNYVRVVNGGNVPNNINPDFNGDGFVSISDRKIIIASLQNTTTITPTLTITSTPITTSSPIITITKSTTVTITPVTTSSPCPTCVPGGYCPLSPCLVQ